MVSQKNKSALIYFGAVIILALDSQGYISVRRKCMRRYETIVIIDPDLQDEARKKLFERYTTLIDQEKGILVKFDEWGNSKLAYEINKKPRGHYICLTYGGTGELIKEFERNLRLDENVMKFMTILLSKDVSEEELQQEITAAENDQTPVETTETADTDDDTETEKITETSEETEED